MLASLITTKWSEKYERICEINRCAQNLSNG